MHKISLRRCIGISKQWPLKVLWFFFCIRDQENDRAVEEVLASKGKQQKELISGLLEDEKYQRDAFSALFIKQVCIAHIFQKRVLRILRVVIN